MSRTYPMLRSVARARRWLISPQQPIMSVFLSTALIVLLMMLLVVAFS